MSHFYFFMEDIFLKHGTDWFVFQCKFLIRNRKTNTKFVIVSTLLFCLKINDFIYYNSLPYVKSRVRPGACIYTYCITEVCLIIMQNIYRDCMVMEQ